MQDALDYSQPLIRGKVRKYPSFVNFLVTRSYGKSPEQRERELLTGTGEFSAHMEIAFEKHLKKLRENRVLYI